MKRDVKKKLTTTIRLPVKLKEELEQEADKRGISLNAEMLICLREGLKRR